MELNTASEVISLARELEANGADFYRTLAERYARDSEVLLSFADENKKNAVQIERAYYGVITDALEGCFSFKIDPHEYAPETGAAENTDYSDALNQALEMEQRTIKFYTDAAEQSKSLLADVPRAFTRIARRRADRIARLKSLLPTGGR